GRESVQALGELAQRCLALGGEGTEELRLEIGSVAHERMEHTVLAELQLRQRAREEAVDETAAEKAAEVGEGAVEDARLDERDGVAPRAEKVGPGVRGGGFGGGAGGRGDRLG